MNPDLYEAYYSAKLWGLLPAIYRTGDSAQIDQCGPLRELIDRIAAQAALLRRSIDRLWEDQYIETCDDWVIPYIADLLATNLVPSLDARGQRVDVAKTIYYRRRKGTVAILEEIAADITGWEAHVVEFFRRLGRTRHGLDPAIGLPQEQTYPDRLQASQGLIGSQTHTGIGGLADVRNRYGASRASSAFDEFFHYADVRRPAGNSGWYNIPRLGVFLWRLRTFRVPHGTPVAIASCPDWFTFDPTGRDIPLFAAASRRLAQAYGDEWVSPEEWQLPGRIDANLLAAFGDQLYPDSIGVYTLPGVAGYVLTPRGKVDLYPEQGRFHLQISPGSTPVAAIYHYGFSSTIGAGPYDRRTREGTEPLPTPIGGISGGVPIAPPATGTLRITDSLTSSAAAPVTVTGSAAVVAANEQRPVVRPAAGFEWRFTGSPGAQLTIDGLLVSGGADIVLAGEFDRVLLRSVTLDPGSLNKKGDALTTAADSRPLACTRLSIEGTVRELDVERSILGPVRVRHTGVLESLHISDSILQAVRTHFNPAFAAADILDSTRLARRLRDGHTPLTKFLQPLVASPDLVNYKETAPPSGALLAAIVQALNDAVNGANLYTAARFAGVTLTSSTLALALAPPPPGPALAALNRLLLEEALPLELAEAALAMPEGATSLERVTVLGRMYIHSLEASESILDDVAYVEDAQRGCVRFSAWSTGSVLPRKYESVEMPASSPLFTSRRFGDPGYAQLLESVDGTISQGAEDGSEMGAFAAEKNPIKERSLLLKFEEFMPLGLGPAVIHAS